MPAHKIHIYDKIHEIAFNSKGAYTWDIVYNMPIWLRNYIYSKLEKFYEQKEDNPPPQTNKPPVNISIKKSDYSTKAPK